MKNILWIFLLFVAASSVSAQQLRPKPLPSRPPLNRPAGGSGNMPTRSSTASGDLDADLIETAGRFGEVVGQGMGMLLSSGRGWDSFCNRLDIGMGYGIDYGGLGLKINYQAPVVFGVTAGFGYNPTYDPATGDDKKFLWNAGLQLWCTDHWNFELGIGPRYFKKYGDTQLGISAMTHYQHQVYGRLGVIGGIGGSLSTKTPDGFKKSDVQARFEWNVGLVFRLLSD